MANYYGVGRTNRFKVKDPKAFLAWAETFKSCAIHHEGKDVFWLEGHEENGEFMSNDEDEPDEFLTGIAKHLAKDAVAIFMHAGNEKLRYIEGWAFAINSKGQKRTVSLNSIYARAAKLSSKPVGKARW